MIYYVSLAFFLFLLVIGDCVIGVGVVEHGVVVAVDVGDRVERYIERRKDTPVKRPRKNQVIIR